MTVAAAVDVELSIGELRHAIYAGVDRTVRALARGAAERYGHSPEFAEDLIDAVIGTLGEAAAAKGTGRYWPAGSTTLDYGGDIGGVHVRARRHDYGPDTHLLLHPDDADDAPHLLVVPVRMPRRFRLAGWIWGRDGKRDNYWRPGGFDGRSCWAIPERELEAVELLP